MVHALDKYNRITTVPFQKPDLLAPLGLTIRDCETQAWAIVPTGEMFGGAASINLTLAVAWGTRLPVWVYVLPGMRALQDAIYRWVARNRGRFPGDTPHCQQFPEDCGKE